jgi:hypothetical protein
VRFTLICDARFVVILHRNFRPNWLIDNTFAATGGISAAM